MIEMVIWKYVGFVTDKVLSGGGGRGESHFTGGDLPLWG